MIVISLTKQPGAETVLNKTKIFYDTMFIIWKLQGMNYAVRNNVVRNYVVVQYTVYCSSNTILSVVKQLLKSSLQTNSFLHQMVTIIIRRSCSEI